VPWSSAKAALLFVDLAAAEDMDALRRELGALREERRVPVQARDLEVGEAGTERAGREALAQERVKGGRKKVKGAEEEAKRAEEEAKRAEEEAKRAEEEVKRAEKEAKRVEEEAKRPRKRPRG